MNKKFLGLFFLVLLGNNNGFAQNFGHFVYRSQITNLKTGRTDRMFPNKNYWIRDSFVVAESVAMAGLDSLDVHRSWDEVWGYAFFHLGKKQYYEYLHFSDTAKLMATYNAVNDFKNRMRLYYVDDQPSKGLVDTVINQGINLPDTIIGNKGYQRYRFTLHVKNGEEAPTACTYTLYFDCEAKSSFTYFKWLSEKKKCAVVRFDTKSNGWFSQFEILQLSSELTPEQLKAFNAWEKYANEHPVK